jgi:hypothetical protein
VNIVSGWAVAGTLLVAACQAGSAAPSVSPTVSPSTSHVATHDPASTRSTAAGREPHASPLIVVVRYRLARHTTDAATAGFAALVEATLTDKRGWRRAGFRLVRDARATFVVVIGEPAEVQRLCEPYDVYRKYSCQNGPVVALNAERWRHATPTWTGSLVAYQQMLINHEVGHLLGLDHPAPPSCPRRGVPARVMSQQSTELNGCLPNPWPLPEEIDRVARHDLPLAPPYKK